MKERPLKDWINIIFTLLIYFVINPVICYFLFVSKHYVWFGLWTIFTVICFLIAFFGKKIMVWFLQKKVDALLKVR